MRDRYEDLKSWGAEVIAIGMGEPSVAAGFRDRERIPFPLLVDAGRRTYAALGLRRGSLKDILGPGVVWRALRSLGQGNGLAKAREDPLQLGGAILVAPDGAVEFEHHNRTSADLIPVDRVIAVLQDMRER